MTSLEPVGGRGRGAREFHIDPSLGTNQEHIIKPARCRNNEYARASSRTSRTVPVTFAEIVERIDDDMAAAATEAVLPNSDVSRGTANR
jgi:hypothetical protein